MNNEILKDCKSFKVIKYNTFNNKYRLYFLYLYDFWKYNYYKKIILEGFTITKIYKLKTCIKFIYKKGYNPVYKIQYYENFNKIWIKRAIELWLRK
jgi:hypothetical protein